MVNVRIFRTASGDVVGFTASGHAGYARKGQDIVCAAVSVLTQTAVLALPKHANVTPTVSVKSGRLTCRLPDQLDPQQAERAQVILQSIVTGLVEVAREYSKYIRIKEVQEE